MRFPVLLFALGAIAVACNSPAPDAKSPLLTPAEAQVGAPAPDSFVVHFETTRGDFDLKVRRDWAPLGAGRVYYLASNGFFDSVRFFRVLPGFLVQFGINGNPKVTTVWKDRRFKDDPFARHSNARGTVSFATDGPNTRNTQLFINYKDNAPLDKDGFVPVGEVTSGMAVLDSLYDGYGEGPPYGIGPNQGLVMKNGNAYLAKFFPSFDFVKSAKVSAKWSAP